MKFLHISDLHLGKRVNEFSMITDQEYILKEILQMIDAEAPDGLLVAGDVFDRSIPSEEAVKLWEEFLIALVKREVPVYAISGNHDSAVRFADKNTLIEQTGIHLSPVYDGSLRHITVEDAYGPLHIWLMPFVKPAVVRAVHPDADINDYTDACRVVLAKEQIQEAERNILVAHQFVIGASTCESEEISVGGLDQVSASVFDAFDYVALGHIHGPQKISRETMRYSGTPLKYSFSEVHHNKSVTVVEMGAKGQISLRELPLKPHHDMREIRGSFAELTDKSFCEEQDRQDYLHVILTDEEDIYDAIGTLRLRYPNIMKLSYDNTRTRSQNTLKDLEEIRALDPLELFDDFYETQNGQKMSEEQRAFMTDLIGQIKGGIG